MTLKSSILNDRQLIMRKEILSIYAYEWKDKKSVNIKLSLIPLLILFIIYYEYGEYV